MKRKPALIFSSITNLWKRPATKMFVPVTIFVIVTLIFRPSKLVIIVWPLSSTQYSDPAIIEKAQYLTFILKKVIEYSSAKDLYYKGTALYDQDNFTEAAKQLTAFIEQKDNDANGHFDLGVTILLTDEIECVIKHLRLATELSRIQSNKLLL